MARMYHRVQKIKEIKRALRSGATSSREIAACLKEYGYRGITSRKVGMFIRMDMKHDVDVERGPPFQKRPYEYCLKDSP